MPLGFSRLSKSCPSQKGQKYRAVCRAKSRADFINKLKIVEEEADESLFWLEFITDLELIHKKLLKDLIKEANELISIFTASLKTSKINRNS